MATNRPSADANDAQRAAWNGEAGEHWVAFADAFDAQLAPYIAPLLDAADISATSAVLDVGCGCGATTLAAARRAPDGTALGCDLSAPMLAVARARAERQGIVNTSFEVADAQVDPLGAAGSVDVAISRFGVMFFADPVAGFTNIARSLAPGARLAFVCWQALERNDWMRVPAEALARVVPSPGSVDPSSPGPFAFGDPGVVGTLLAGCGFEGIELTAIDEPRLVGGGLDLDGSVAFLRGSSLARSLLADVDDETERRALDEVRAALSPYATSDGVLLGASAWLVRATHR